MNTLVGQAPSAVVDEAPNRVYYLKIGAGEWIGTFDFSITDRVAFRSADLAIIDRVLAISMHLLLRVLGPAPIYSRIVPYPAEGEFGVATNLVIIRKFRIPLYHLFERYVLNSNGRDVWVESDERFGPVPFLLNHHKAHPAEILNQGMKSIYYIPLLGSSWTGTYIVSTDRDHIKSTLTCPWASAHEVIHRVS
jgi:hypothetical protein